MISFGLKPRGKMALKMLNIEINVGYQGLYGFNIKNINVTNIIYV